MISTPAMEVLTRPTPKIGDASCSRLAERINQ